MHPFQKMAWYNLGVVLLSVSGFVGLYAATGHFGGSLGASGGLGLLGFSSHFLEGRRKELLGDEYTNSVNRRVVTVSFGVFWFYHVAGYVFLILYNGVSRDITAIQFFAYFIGGFTVLVTAYSVATLLIYGSDQTKRLTLVDRWRQMEELRKGGLMGLFITAFVGSGFFIAFPIMRKSVPENFLNSFIGMVDISLLVALLSMRRRLERLTSGGEHLARIIQAKRVSLIAMLVAGVASAAGLGLAALFPLPFNPGLYHILLCAFYVIWIGMMTPFLALFIPNTSRYEIPEKSVAGPSKSL